MVHLPGTSQCDIIPIQVFHDFFCAVYRNTLFSLVPRQMVRHVRDFLRETLSALTMAAILPFMCRAAAVQVASFRGVKGGDSRSLTQGPAGNLLV